MQVERCSVLRQRDKRRAWAPPRRLPDGKLSTRGSSGATAETTKRSQNTLTAGDVSAKGGAVSWACIAASV